MPVPARPTASGARGAEGRVAAVHRQTRRGLSIALGFGVVALVAAITGYGSAWVPLHLFLVGALLSAMSATTQMLAVTWSSSPPPGPRLAAAQRWVLAAGAVAVVAGRDRGEQWLVEVGGTAVVAALLAMVPILVGIRRQAVTDRFAPAIDAYVAAFLFGAVGTPIGIVLATDRAGNSYGELRGVHLIVNLFGLVGLVVAATLPYFVATHVRAKMSPRATPLALRSIIGVLVVATIVAAVGRLLELSIAVVVGLALYAAGLVATVALLPIFDRKRWRWAGPRLVQLVTGVAWWIATTVWFAVTLARDTADQAVLRTLVIGGFAQILVASLAYLGPVLRGGGHALLTAGFATTRSWISVAAGNVAAVGAMLEADAVLIVALTVWLVDVAARAVRLLSAPRPT